MTNSAGTGQGIWEPACLGVFGSVIPCRILGTLVDFTLASVMGAFFMEPTELVTMGVPDFPGIAGNSYILLQNEEMQTAMFQSPCAGLQLLISCQCTDIFTRHNVLALRNIYFFLDWLHQPDYISSPTPTSPGIMSKHCLRRKKISTGWEI